MKTTLLRLAAAVAATALLAACGSSGDAGSDSGTATAGVLRVGTLGDAPPNIYQENGQYTGFDNELLKAIAEKAGLRTEFVGTDFSALLGQVNNRTFDVGSSAIAQTEERKKTVDFSDPYNYEYVSILTKQGSPITDVTSLKGRRVGVVQATVGDKYLTTNVPDAQVVRFPDYNAQVAGLRTDAVEGLILDLTIAEKFAKDNPNDRFTVSGTIEAKDLPHGFAVRKGNDVLRAKLNDGLRAVIADGTWVRLHDKFIPSVPVQDRFKPAS